MRGDYSRVTGPRAKREAYHGVILQQGRVLLDADWNEQTTINLDRFRDLARIVVGGCGVKREGSAFGIVSGGSGGFRIRPGWLFVDGLPIQNRSVRAYGEQGPPDLFPPPASLLAENEEALVYIEAWLRDISAAEAPALKEVALDGPDTTTRMQLAWAARLVPLSDLGMSRSQVVAAVRAGTRLQIPFTSPTTGLMAASIADPETTANEGPCELPPEAGYLDQQNRLYRIEIHRGGAFAGPSDANPPTFKWSGEPDLTVRLTRTQPPENALVIDPDARGAAALYAANARVELVEAAREAAGASGPLCRITSEPDEALAFDPPIAVPGLERSPRLRLWQRGESGDAETQMTGDWQVLEKGVRIRFRSGFYRPGAYWFVPARSATGTVEWPPYDPPDRLIGTDAYVAPFGGDRVHCPLFIVRREGANARPVTDLRKIFPPLTDIRAADVSYQDRDNALGGAQHVQEAIDRLKARPAGTCTVVARRGDNLAEVFERIEAGAHAQVCLPVGDYVLSTPLTVSGRGHLVIKGAGRGTRIVIRGSLQALHFRRCASVTISDLAVSAGVTGTLEQAQSTGGMNALGFEDCGPVLVERAQITCGHGRREATSCLRAYQTDAQAIHRPGRGDVTVRDCECIVGDQQVGIVVVNGAKVRIEDNRLWHLHETSRRIFARWIRDPTVRSGLAALMVRFLRVARGAPPATLALRPATVRGAYWSEVDMDDFASEFHARFFSARALAEPWEAYLRSDISRGVGRNTEVDEVAQHIRRVARTIWSNDGQVRLGRDRSAIVSNRFRPFYNRVQDSAAPAMRRGIAVVGRVAEDVAVVGNRIDSALLAVHVGVSDRTAAAAGGRAVARRAGRIRIEDNMITLRDLPLNTDRHGVFVGSAERIAVSGNDVATENRRYESGRLRNVVADGFQTLFSHGIEIRGPRGRFLTITENSVLGTYFGIAVDNPNEPVRQRPPWLVRDNVIQETAEPLLLPPPSLVRGIDENVV